MVLMEWFYKLLKNLHTQKYRYLHLSLFVACLRSNLSIPVNKITNQTFIRAGKPKNSSDSLLLYLLYCRTVPATSSRYVIHVFTKFFENNFIPILGKCILRLAQILSFSAVCNVIWSNCLGKFAFSSYSSYHSFLLLFYLVRLNIPSLSISIQQAQLKQ